jgi:hypothetical protein
MSEKAQCNLLLHMRRKVVAVLGCLGCRRGCARQGKKGAFPEAKIERILIQQILL